MNLFLHVLAAVIILFALNVLGVWVAFRVVRESGLSEEEQAEVLYEARGATFRELPTRSMP